MDLEFRQGILVGDTSLNSLHVICYESGWEIAQNEKKRWEERTGQERNL